MINNKFSVFLPLILMIFLVSSCINYDQITNVNSDGSGKMYLHCWVKLLPEYDSLNLRQFALFNEDSLSNIFSSPYTDIENVIVYDLPKENTLHAKVTLTFDNFDSLNMVRGFSNLNYSLKEGPDNTLILSHFLNPFPVGIGVISDTQQISYTYHLPGEIVKHNATKQTRNKLEWIYTANDISKFQTLSVTYRPFKLKETPVWIYYLALSVFIIVIVFLFRSRSK